MRKPWLLLALPIAAFDQWVKWWVHENLWFKVMVSASGQHSQPFLPGLDLTYARNTGAAFSFLSGVNARWFLAAISTLAAAAIVYAVCKGWVKTHFGLIAVSCVLGGAVGNLIDRVRLGYVIDMFRFTFIDFAIFNVADIFISIGGICFCLHLLLEMKNKDSTPTSRP